MSADRELLESWGSANDISALASIRALTSRTARLCCSDPRRPATFEGSVNVKGINDCVQGALLFYKRERGRVSQPPAPKEPSPVISLM
jgi:hypothetical protein